MRSLLILLILLTILSALSQAKPINDPVSYSSFCNAIDKSGNENHSAMVGNPSCISGQLGECFLFNGCLFKDSLPIQVLFGQCTSSCSGRLGENIFPDGDFGSGTANIVTVDPGIAPGYQYNTVPPPNDGYYCLTNNTSSWGSFAGSDWINIQDNGPEANGYMMVVNASYQPGIFYQHTVDVCESTLYEFSIDIISMLESHLSSLIKPNLAFLIDGNQVCETGNIAADEQWHTARFSFTTSPGQNTVTLALRNSAPGGGGNDLAIDNISFRACGPEIILPPIVKFCNEKPLVELSPVLNSSPYPTIVYQWQIFSNGAWADIPNANAQNLSIPNPLDGDQYRLLVANSNGNLQLPNCRVVSEPVKLQLSVDLAIAPVIQQITCNGSANGAINGAVSGGSAPYNYLWNNGSTSVLLNNLTMGLYILSVTDNKGCTAMSMTQILEPAPITLDLAGTDITCQGLSDGALTATVGGGITPYNFLWNSGQTLSELTGLDAGNFQLTVTDAHDCSVTGSKTLIELLVPSANIGNDVVVELGDYIDLTAISSILPNEIADYTWSGPGDFLQCADCKSHRFQPTHTGCHTVIVRSIIGCEGLDTVCYEVIPLLRVYIPNSFSPNDDGLNDRFSVFSDQSVALVRNLSVFNRWGELVYQGLDLLPNSESAGWDGTFKGNSLRPDVFTWVAELEFIDGVRTRYSGDVTLVR